MIIVLNWRRPRETLRCLASLNDLNYPRLRIVVVYNGSEDGSEETIRRARPDLPIMQTGKNLGFAGGNNVGIRSAMTDGADFVWILNNDTVVNPRALDEAVAAAAQDDRIGIVGSATYTSSEPWNDARLYPTGGLWDGRVERLLLCDGDPACADRGVHRVDFVQATMLLRISMLTEIGLLDERFFHYFEERELSHRARARGWGVVLACGSHIWHAGGATLSSESPQALYYYVRNRLLFGRAVWEDRPGMTLLLEPGRPWWLLSNLGRMLVRGRFDYVTAMLLGLVDGVRGRTGPRNL